MDDIKDNHRNKGRYTEQDVDDLVRYYLNHDVSDDDGEWIQAEVIKEVDTANQVHIKESNAIYNVDDKQEMKEDEQNLKAVTIRISEADLAMLKRLGKKIGLGHTQVARMIIHDSLVNRRG